MKRREGVLSAALSQCAFPQKAGHYRSQSANPTHFASRVSVYVLRTEQPPVNVSGRSTNTGLVNVFSIVGETTRT